MKLIDLPCPAYAGVIDCFVKIIVMITLITGYRTKKYWLTKQLLTEQLKQK